MVYTVNLVNTVNMDYAADMVCNVDMVFTVEMREMRGVRGMRGTTMGEIRLKHPLESDCHTQVSRSIFKLTVACEGMREMRAYVVRTPWE